jgi:Na+-transporting NADH:ubiquinone oxidoreductase subunit NqrB
MLPSSPRPTKSSAAVRRLPRDPRLLQIATLATLLAIQISAFDFSGTPAQAAVTVGAALATQFLFCRIHGLPADWRSPLISALSLTLLLRTHDPFLWGAASVLAIGSKFLLRVRGKHLFNPSCFAIVALLLTTGEVWVSPGIWGTTLWFAFLAASLGTLVLARSTRLDIALAFLGAYGGLLAARCLVLGDPLAIPLHQMQSGALLVFGLFMITDPRTTPDDRLGRLLFAAAVAAIAYELQFRFQIREGLFYALIIVAPLTPVLDTWRPAARFRWLPVQES